MYIVKESNSIKARSEERRVGKEVRPGVDLCGRRIIKKKNTTQQYGNSHLPPQYARTLWSLPSLSPA